MRWERQALRALVDLRACRVNEVFKAQPASGALQALKEFKATTVHVVSRAPEAFRGPQANQAHRVSEALKAR